jgi:hypothetical protein
MDKLAAKTPMEILAFTIAEFCKSHGISRSLYYQLHRTGEGPDEMRLGGRKAISREAAARWRAARES